MSNTVELTGIVDKTVELTGIVDRTVSLSSIINTWSFSPDTGISNTICMDSGGNVTFSDHASIDNLHLGDFTIEMWVKPSNTGTGAMLSKYNNADPQRGWLFNADGIFNNFTFVMFSTPPEYVYCFTSPGVYTPGNWHHVAVTYELATTYATIYVGGVDQSVVQAPSAQAFLSDAGLAPIIGGDAGDSVEPYDGCYQWINITNTVKYTAGFTPPVRTTKPSTTDSIFNVPNKEGAGSVAYDVIEDYEGVFGGNAAWS